MLIVDGHLDLAWNAVQWGRDLTRSALTIRALEGATAGKGRGLGTVALPELRRGRVALCFATLLARSTGRPVPHIDYPSPAQAHAAAMGHLAYYRALEHERYAVVIADAPALDAHIARWQAWEQEPVGEPPPLGLVISMEGADPILAPDRLSEWHAAGLRLLGLAHYGPCRYAGGTGDEGGLTDHGRVLLPELRRLGVGLDLTHCSDAAFWETLERYDGPVLASHHNCRALVPSQRQLADEQIRAVAERGGVIGAALDTWMLKPGWLISERPDSRNPPVTLGDVVDQIDYVCQLTGSSRHAAIGSDLDGGFGREQSPRDLDTIADLQRIAELLAGRGYAAADVAAIMHGNWLRLLRELWGGQ
jgi:membrane dipeptidase